MNGPNICTGTRDEVMKAAVKKVERGASIKATAREYGIKRITLYDHARGRYKGKVAKKGLKEKLLQESEEKALVQFLVYMSQHSHPLTRKMLKLTVLSMVKNSAPNKTKINMAVGPSDDWCRKFLRRHPELVVRKGDPAEKSRLEVSRHQIEQYFDLLNNTLKELNLERHPEQIFNCDEMGLSGKNSPREKVIVGKGSHPYQCIPTLSGHLTLHMAVSAAGQVIPPFIIFSKSFPRASFAENIPENWSFGVSENGYMDTELFKKWFSSVFIPNCHSAVNRPILLLMDNHSSHLSPDLIELATANNIHILCFPAHATHLLQPLDKTIFRLIKHNIVQQITSLGYTCSAINRSRLPLIIKYALSLLSTHNIEGAFRVTGLFPFNPNSVLQSTKSSLKPQHAATAGGSEDDRCKTCGNLVVNPLVKMGLIPEDLKDVLVVPATNIKQAKRKQIKEARLITAKDLHVQEVDPVTIHEDSQHSGGDVNTDTETVCEVCLTTGNGSEEWIGCDGCTKWYHYSCLPNDVQVDVNLSLVCESPWLCITCCREI